MLLIRPTYPPNAVSQKSLSEREFPCRYFLNRLFMAQVFCRKIHDTNEGKSPIYGIHISQEISWTWHISLSPNLSLHCTVLATMPVSTAAPERSSSILRSLRISLRNSTGQERPSHIHFSEPITENIVREAIPPPPYSWVENFAVFVCIAYICLKYSYGMH